MARKIRLYSPHAPIPLARILEEEMDREWTQKQKNKGRVFGRGTEHKIFLKVELWGQRDDSSYSLSGTMTAERGGTLIEGRIGRIGKARFFVVFWFAFLSLFVAVGISTWLFADAPLAFAAMFVGIPGFMMLMGGWLFSRSAKRGPEDERRILEYLADKVDARPTGWPD
ncbi:MAG: hypothetical protein AAF067_06100 [Pseudomonadota bacterium]